ncbi:MAG: aminofutalosine synthase MqnE [Deltaproteobacteria bacterium]|nr:MAG: aminofutalosine synthase MqnE [Deltaproteobacteria bacterium]
MLAAVDPRSPHPRPLSEPVRAVIERAGLGDVLARVEAGVRLDAADGRRLFAAPLAAVGLLANRVRERMHGDACFYNRNLHINATNVCEASCVFCSFARLKTGDPQAWTLSHQQAVGRLRALSDVMVTEVHIVNGLNPDLPFDYYTTLMRALRDERPDIHIKGFTAVEIHYYAEKYGLSYDEVLDAFIDAGLGSLPGGGAEIFAPRARRKLCDDKVDAEGWLEVHRVAHRKGLRTNCTMLFGSIETIDERIDHLLRLRALQDESLAARQARPDAGLGAMQTFIPLRFHNENNGLQRLRAPTHLDSLRTIAVSRLLLDNVPHIKAYWPMLGEDVAQLALAMGADDLDGTVREEHIYHMAGASTPQGLARSELLRLIEDAGRRPIERDTLYRVVSGADWRLDVPAPDATLRIGAVAYRNAWPLTRFLADDPGVHLQEGHPSEVARWLADGEVDLALLPVGALLTDPGLRIVPDLAIGCDGPVESVLLVAEQPPERWRRVLLDGVSRTSVLLARLLLTRGPLADRVRDDLEIVDAAPGSALDGAAGDVAAVVIGDVARALPARLGHRIDLGAVWKEWTGLPFVFAVWAGRADLHPALVEKVRQAGLRGVAALQGAGELGAGDGAPPLLPDDLRYLREAIRYPLDDAAMMGLRRFAALAAREGLVPHDIVALYPPAADLPRAHQAEVASLLRRASRGERLDEEALSLLEEHAPLPELVAAAARRGSSDPVTYRVAGEGGEPGSAPVEVPRRDGESAAAWLRRVCLATLGGAAGGAVTVDLQDAGLAAAAVALLCGADALAPLDPDTLQVEGCDTWEEALVEIERAIEDAGRVPLRVDAGGATPRAALSGARKYRPLRGLPAARRPSS